MLAYPDAYTVGISNLGNQVLYALANDTDCVACDRTYCPLPDAEEVMRAEKIPLFGWETRRAVADFDIVGFSLAHEGCATNVLTMLDLAGVPIHAAERGAGARWLSPAIRWSMRQSRWCRLSTCSASATASRRCRP